MGAFTEFLDDVNKLSAVSKAIAGRTAHFAGGIWPMMARPRPFVGMGAAAARWKRRVAELWARGGMRATLLVLVLGCFDSVAGSLTHLLMYGGMSISVTRDKVGKVHRHFSSWLHPKVGPVMRSNDDRSSEVFNFRHALDVLLAHAWLVWAPLIGFGLWFVRDLLFTACEILAETLVVVGGVARIAGAELLQ